MTQKVRSVSCFQCHQELYSLLFRKDVVLIYLRSEYSWLCECQDSLILSQRIAVLVLDDRASAHDVPSLDTEGINKRNLGCLAIRSMRNLLNRRLLKVVFFHVYLQHIPLTGMDFVVFVAEFSR